MHQHIILVSSSSQRTQNLVLYSLVLPNSVGVSLTFVLFSIEVLDRLVVEEAISMDTTSNLQIR
jgi:hypothetical protein